MNNGYGLIKLIFRIYMMIFIRKVKVSGWKNLIDGPKIVVANHPNMTDSFVLPFIFSEDITFLIQAETFSVPIIGFLLRKSGHIPVVKGQGKIALNTALERLSKGGTVVIFPEGKLSHGKELSRAGSGAAVLAKKSGAPILPIGFYVSPQDTLILKGNFQNRKTFAHWQIRGCCHVNIGEPWSVIENQRDNICHIKLREITKLMMAQISDLVQEAHSIAKNRNSEMDPRLFHPSC